MKIKCAVVGLGEMGQAHARNYVASPQAELYAACDLDQTRVEAFSAKFPVKKTYRTVAELAADPDVKAVSVAVPNRWHAEVSEVLLRAGKSVLVEKPMATSMAEAEAMARAAEQGKAVLQTGFMWRFHKDVRFVRDALAAGKIGKSFYVRYCSVTIGPPGGQTGARTSDMTRRMMLGEILQRDEQLTEQQVEQALARQKTEGGKIGEVLVRMKFATEQQVQRALERQATAVKNELWYLRKSIARGGILFDMGVHGIDTVRYLLGSPATRSVYARSAQVFQSFWSSSDPVEDVALLLLELEGGVLANIECAWAPKHTDPLPEGQCVIVGSQGYASLFPTRVKYQDKSGAWRMEVPVPSEANDATDMYQRQVEHFLECVRTGSRSLNDPKESIESVRITDAAYESTRTNQPVRF